MQSKSEMASELFVPGFNCAQSVLAPFCEKYDLDMETALKMTSGLGGGCNLGELCGAIIGATMVIGLSDGRYLIEDRAARKNCDAKVAQFVSEFRTMHGNVVCRDLLGLDITTEEGLAQKLAIPRDESPCNTFVKDAVEILEKLGY